MRRKLQPRIVGVNRLFVKSIHESVKSREMSTVTAGVKRKPELMDGKNALMTLNQAEKGLKWELVSHTGPPHQPTFVLAVEFRGKRYTGQGTNKRDLKNTIAQDILQTVEVVIPKKEEADSEPKPAKVPKTTASGGASGATTDNAYKTPAMVLNETCRTVRYELVSEIGESTSKRYIMKAVLDPGSASPRSSQGSGSSKKMAKQRCAANALKTFFNLNVSMGEKPIVELTQNQKHEMVGEKSKVLDCKVVNVRAASISFVKGSHATGDSGKFDAQKTGSAKDGVEFRRITGKPDGSVEGQPSTWLRGRFHRGSSNFNTRGRPSRFQGDPKFRGFGNSGTDANTAANRLAEGQQGSVEHAQPLPVNPMGSFGYQDGLIGHDRTLVDGLSFQRPNPGPDGFNTNRGKGGFINRGSHRPNFEFPSGEDYLRMNRPTLPPTANPEFEYDLSNRERMAEGRDDRFGDRHVLLDGRDNRYTETDAHTHGDDRDTHRADQGYNFGDRGMHDNDLELFYNELRTNPSDVGFNRFDPANNPGGDPPESHYNAQRYDHSDSGFRRSDKRSHHGDRGAHHVDRGAHHGDRGAHHGNRGAHHGDRGAHHGDRGALHGDRGAHHGDRGVHHGDRGVYHGDRGFHHGDRGFHHNPGQTFGDQRASHACRDGGTLPDSRDSYPMESISELDKNRSLDAEWAEFQKNFHPEFSKKQTRFDDKFSEEDYRLMGAQMRDSLAQMGADTTGHVREERQPEERKPLLDDSSSFESRSFNRNSVHEGRFFDREPKYVSSTRRPPSGRASRFSDVAGPSINEIGEGKPAGTEAASLLQGIPSDIDVRDSISYNYGVPDNVGSPGNPTSYGRRYQPVYRGLYQNPETLPPRGVSSLQPGQSERQITGVPQVSASLDKPLYNSPIGCAAPVASLYAHSAAVPSPYEQRVAAATKSYEPRAALYKSPALGTPQYNAPAVQSLDLTPQTQPPVSYNAPIGGYSASFMSPVVYPMGMYPSVPYSGYQGAVAGTPSHSYPVGPVNPVHMNLFYQSAASQGAAPVAQYQGYHAAEVAPTQSVDLAAPPPPPPS